MCVSHDVWISKYLYTCVSLYVQLVYMRTLCCRAAPISLRTSWSFHYACDNSIKWRSYMVSFPTTCLIPNASFSYKWHTRWFRSGKISAGMQHRGFYNIHTWDERTNMDNNKTLPTHALHAVVIIYFQDRILPWSQIWYNWIFIWTRRHFTFQCWAVILCWKLFWLALDSLEQWQAN